MDVYTPTRTVDFTDTGLWRLIIFISRRGMTAMLRHTDDPTQPLVLLFETEWETDDAHLLSRIESGIYDNPRVLEDYATDIIIRTETLTWVPTKIINENEVEETVFSTIFPTCNATPMTECVGDMTALFALTSGLEAFIRRTIPGARVRSHLGVLVEYMGKMTGNNTQVFVDITSGQADILLFDKQCISAAVTHQWRAVSDIGYRICQVAESLGLKPGQLEVSLSGLKEECNELKDILTPICRSVSWTVLPLENAEHIPTAAAFLAGQTRDIR
ncbi:MAG: DUF3822 family protein [Muribaculaceae bacterium]|nr:DUF3822 family protein [Muribaculaceae bacterium]